MQRDAGLLVDMTQAAQQIVLFRGQMDFEQFRKDSKTQSAIIHQFLIIGEVAKLLSDEFKNANPSLPWSAMARMRDTLWQDLNLLSTGRSNRPTEGRQGCRQCAC